MTNSPICNTKSDSETPGLSITLGSWEIGPDGDVTVKATGAPLGNIHCMRADTRSATEQAVLAAWAAYLAAPAPRGHLRIEAKPTPENGMGPIRARLRSSRTHSI